MKYLLAALITLGALPSQAAPVDDVLSAVTSLGLTVARIKVVSENCNIPIDPKLETRIYGDLVFADRDVNGSEVKRYFAKAYDNERHASGTECQASAQEELKTLKSIYDMSYSNLSDILMKHY